MLSSSLRSVAGIIQRSYVVNLFAVSVRPLAASAQSMANIPENEPILDYRRGSKERTSLDQRLLELYDSPATVVPIVIGDEEIHSNDVRYQVMPFEHGRRLAQFSYASSELLHKAIDVAVAARTEWELKSLQERVVIFLRAADLCAGKYRMDLNAATMLGQAKTIFQAEIDSACELADFLRFNCYFALSLEKYEPKSTDAYTDRMVYRGLEGFVAAISPFNFTAIGGNLASAPALMGNSVLWKPSDTALLSSYTAFKIFREAGVPPGVINFVPSDGPVFGDTVTSSKHLAGVNFTGSVPTFRRLWKQVGDNLEKYHNFPRLVGECGGKNFHFVHASADMDVVAACSVRGAFEYQGQKCSACSRLFVPQSAWPSLKQKMLAIRSEIQIGTPLDHGVFFSAVIDKRAFDRIKAYIDYAKNNAADLQIVAGGKCDDAKGYFIEPTIIETRNPGDKLMKEEIFGPVLTVYAYPDNECDQILASVKDATPYALTGAVFATDNADNSRQFLEKAKFVLRYAAGNFYVNDKSTGAVVGQQPFGGGRLSGTNDKAGGPHYLLKWMTPLVIKEALSAQKAWRYPSMD